MSRLPKNTIFSNSKQYFSSKCSPRVVLTSLGLGWTLSKTQRYAQIENECVSAVWVLFNKYSELLQQRNTQQRKILHWRNNVSRFLVISKHNKNSRILQGFHRFLRYFWSSLCMLTKIQHYRRIFQHHNRTFTFPRTQKLSQWQETFSFRF